MVTNVVTRRIIPNLIKGDSMRKYRYTETCMTIRQCIQKGYLSYEPLEFPVEHGNYRVCVFLGTFVVHEKVPLNK